MGYGTTKRRVWLVVLAAAAACAVTVRAVAFDTKPPAKPIVIKGCQDKQPPVTFDHPAHVKGMEMAKATCTVCHHQVKGAPPAKNRCSECHTTKQSDKIGTCKDASQSTNPFHVLCVGCHKKMQDKHPKAPSKCGECHKK